MAEIRTIPEKILASGIKDTSIDAVGKFSKKVIHHNAGAPTAADDTGLGYAVGSIWVDSTNGDMYTAVSVTAEDANWKNMEGDNVNDPFVAQGTTYGWIAGGSVDPISGVGSLDSITQFNFASPTGGTDVGNLAGARQGGSKGSIRSKTEGIHIGGYTSHPFALQDNIDSFTFAAPSTITDAGDLGVGNVQSIGTTTDGTSGFCMGGATPSRVNTVTKLTLSSPYPQSDNGELATATDRNVGFTDLTYAYSVAGNTPSYVDHIERLAFATTSGTFADSGELVRATGNGAGANGPTKGFYAGGGGPPLNIRHEIDTFTFASPTTSADVGELAGDHHAYLGGGSSSTDYAYFTGGNINSPPESVTTNTISRIAWSATSGGSTDFGELANHYPASPYGVGNANGYESS